MPNWVRVEREERWRRQERRWGGENGEGGRKREGLRRWGEEFKVVS